MNTDLLSAFVLLFLPLSPLGNLPTVLPKQVAPQRCRRVLVRECVIAYVVRLAFLFGERTYLEIMPTSDYVHGGNTHSVQIHRGYDG